MAEMERPNDPNPRRDRSDSNSSIDRELDWLIGTETEEAADYSQNGNEEEQYPRSESRLEEPSSQYPLSDKSEEQHETAVDSDHEEHETATDDGLSDEQRLLELELQKLKEEGFLPMDDPPEYDIADRVRELNEQLRAEGEIPERTDRKVTFSEKVIAVEFPEELYEDEEFETGDSENINTESENADDNETHSSEVTDPNDLEVTKLTLESEGENPEIKSKESEQKHNQNGNGQSPRGQEDKVLIERDGKFELISVKDLSSMERRFMGLEVSPVEDETDQQKHEPVTPNGHGDAPDTTPQQTVTLLQPKPPQSPDHQRQLTTQDCGEHSFLLVESSRPEHNGNQLTNLDGPTPIQDTARTA